MTQQTNMESEDEELSSGDLNLYEEISEDLLDYSEDDEDESIFDESIRNNAIEAVENCILHQLDLWTSLLSNDSNPAFCYPKKSWQNVAYDPEIGLIPKEENVEVTEINFFNQNSRAKYVRMMLVLNRIHQLLIDNEKITKRGLYYQLLVHQGGNMKQIDEAIHSIVVMLQIPRHQLHIMATSKGLLAGNLTFVNEEGVEVDCSHGESIPEVENVRMIKSDAQVVVIIEKDSVFQKLINEDLLKLVPFPILLITGKGVPDLSTRKFVYNLSQILTNSKFTILVDGDPFGIEIMFTYKFGSVSMTYCCEKLAVPKIVWLGIWPSEFQFNENLLKSLSEKDEAKLKSFETRPYLTPEIEAQLEIMKTLKKKAEIEDFESPAKYLWESKLLRENY